MSAVTFHPLHKGTGTQRLIAAACQCINNRAS
jgi:hypothetical protein